MATGRAGGIPSRSQGALVMAADHIIEVYRAANALEAHALCDALNEAGVQARLILASAIGIGGFLVFVGYQFR